jgi:TPR repeat protein
MKNISKDLLVTLCGLVTSFITAGLLALIEVRLHFAVYAFTLWFIIPIGAALSGMAASSGYLVGAEFLNHRLHRFFAINIIGVSVATYFLLNYMRYETMTVNGQPVHYALSFAKYLDLVIQNRQISLLGAASFGRPGSFGYVLTAIQIFGFAAGGLIVYGKVASQLFCERCQRYLLLKASQIGYGPNMIGQVHRQALDLLKSGQDRAARELISRLPSAPAAPYQVALRLWRCPSCSRDIYDLSMLYRDGNKWQPLPDFQTRGMLAAAGDTGLDIAVTDARTVKTSPLRAAASIGVLVISLAGFLLFRPNKYSDTGSLMAEATRYLSGNPGPGDYSRAFEDLRKAAEAGNPFGMAMLGAMYAEGKGVRQDARQAVAWTQKAAAAGNAIGMYSLGLMYANGSGVTRDYGMAAQWYQKASVAGNLDAMNNLGLFYTQGQGVRSDFSAARDLFQRASQAGNLPALHNLGWLCLRSVPPDDKAAASHFEKAAQGGYVPSMKTLAALYLQGKGRARDYAKARQWLMQAANRNDADAMARLGALFYAGLGGPRDVAEARTWFEKAAAAGDPMAAKALAEMTNKTAKVH